MEEAKNKVASGEFSTLAQALNHLVSQSGGGGSAWKAQFYANYIPANQHYACMSKNLDNTPMFKPLDHRATMPKPSGLIPVGAYYAHGGAVRQLDFDSFIKEYARVTGQSSDDVRSSPDVLQAWQMYTEKIKKMSTQSISEQELEQARSMRRARSIEQSLSGERVSAPIQKTFSTMSIPVTDSEAQFDLSDVLAKMNDVVVKKYIQERFEKVLKRVNEIKLDNQSTIQDQFVTYITNNLYPFVVQYAIYSANGINLAKKMAKAVHEIKKLQNDIEETKKHDDKNSAKLENLATQLQAKLQEYEAIQTEMFKVAKNIEQVNKFMQILLQQILADDQGYIPYLKAQEETYSALKSVINTQISTIKTQKVDLKGLSDETKEKMQVFFNKNITQMVIIMMAERQKAVNRLEQLRKAQELIIELRKLIEILADYSFVGRMTDMCLISKTNVGDFTAHEWDIILHIIPDFKYSQDPIKQKDVCEYFNLNVNEVKELLKNMTKSELEVIEKEMAEGQVVTAPEATSSTSWFPDVRSTFSNLRDALEDLSDFAITHRIM